MSEDEIDKIVKEMMASTQAERSKAAEYDKLSYDEKWARERGFANCVDYQNWLAQQKGFVNRAEYSQDCLFKRGIGTGLSMAENKKSPKYLGIFIAERLLPKIFQEPRMMPHGNKGYDAICKNGHRIDVKSSVLRKYINNWSFHIDRNKIADAFLCIGFSGSRNDLVVEHMWLFLGTEIIRGKEVNKLMSLCICDTEYGRAGVLKYELTDKVDDANDICIQFKRRGRL